VKESDFAGIKALNKVKLPRSRIAIIANVSGELNGYKAFKVTAEQLKAANLTASKVKLFYIGDDGKVADESKRIVRNSDGGVTINFTYFSAYILAEDAPIQCTAESALDALKLSLKNAVTVSEIAKYDFNCDGKVTVKDALLFLKASALQRHKTILQKSEKIEAKTPRFFIGTVHPCTL